MIRDPKYRARVGAQLEIAAAALLKAGAETLAQADVEAAALINDISVAMQRLLPLFGSEGPQA